jgi:hypothetical protein
MDKWDNISSHVLLVLQARKNKTVVWAESGKGRDKYAWLLCANRQTHVPEQLLLTQIIPADCLIQIDQRLHECRSEWGIAKHCSCDLAIKPTNENLRSLIKGDLVSVMNGNAPQEIKVNIRWFYRACLLVLGNCVQHGFL